MIPRKVKYNTHLTVCVITSARQQLQICSELEHIVTIVDPGPPARMPGWSCCFQSLSLTKYTSWEQSEDILASPFTGGQRIFASI